jgi:Aerotolerance regulator N-terminal/von Willebrand factor type A domain
MGFFSPWFLVGAAAVALPFYLHLLRRHTTTPHPFSSLMFFEQRTQSSIRHRRLRYLLLLAFRLAVLILLALAFSNPYIKRSVAGASGDKLMLLVIDNSFSMRAGSRLPDAKREAISVLGSRNASERVQVAALGSQLHVMTQPIQDPAVLRQAIDSIDPGDSRNNFSELARAVRSIQESTHSPIELHLFSDMQKTDMPASFAEMAPPANVSLVLHSVAKGAEPNWAVESVQAPSQVWDPKKAHVEAVIAGYHTSAASRTASLVVNGKVVDSRKVDVPAGGRATVDFQTLNVPYGLSRCEVRIDSADSLPADDSYLFAVERSDPQPVLFVHESSDSRSPLFFGGALASAEEASFTLDSVAAERLSGITFSKYAFVVLSDVVSLPPQFENDLARYVRGGGSVLIAAGTSAAHGGRIPILDDNVIAGRDYSRDGERFLTVAETDSSHPSMRGSEGWAGVRFYYAVAVDPSDARVIARLSDQTPLLLDKKIGEGHALLFASGLDNLTNDFPVQPVFVPFVKQVARYLSGTEDLNGSRLVDSFLELRTAKDQAVSVEVIDPAGHRPLSLKEAASAQSYQLTSAGFYSVRLANGTQDLVGVNADRRESNLEPIPDDVLALWSGKSSAGSQQMAAAAAQQDRENRESLWWYAMLLVLVAAVGESLLASRYLVTQAEKP